MLAIKFKRIGKKHQASFRIVVKEKRSKMGGRVTEDIGWYNPRTGTFDVKRERALYWIGVGAKPTPSVHNLLVKGGVVKGKKIAVHKRAKMKDETAAQ